MPKIKLEKQNYACLVLVLFDALFHPQQPEKYFITLKDNSQDKRA